MDDFESLELARETFYLSLIVRATCSGGVGTLDASRLFAISLGPWSIGRQELDGIDRDRAAWGLETLATQNLAIALDSALERVIPLRLSDTATQDRDYFCFVRCLRNAFAHAPLSPTWVLSNPEYRRRYSLPREWEVDLTLRHGSRVVPADYRHAGGLVLLADHGIALMREWMLGAASENGTSAAD
jgi:hypothetical protein